MTTLETSNNSPRTAFNDAAPQGFVGAALGRVLAELEPPGAAPKTPPGEPNVFDLGSLGAQEAAIKQANAQGDMGPQSFTFGGAAAKRQEEALAAKEKRDKEHKEQMFQQLLERYRYLQTQIDTLEGYQEALGRHLQKLKHGEEIEVNADGSLADEQAEEAIRAFEERYGIEVDRHDARQIERVIEAQADEQATYRREAEQIIEQAPEVKQEAKKLDRVDAQEAVAIIEKSKENGQSFIESDAILAKMDNNTNQVEIVKSQGFNDTGTQAAIELATIGDAVDEEELLSLGSVNPVTKGDTKQSFAAAAAQSHDILKVESDDPQLKTVLAPANTA